MGDYELLSHFMRTQLIFIIFERFTEHAFNSKSRLNPYWAEISAIVKCESQLCGTAENRVPEWRATLAGCQNGGKKRVLDTDAWLLGRFFAERHVDPARELLKFR
jgi:hypothetical protein